MWMAAILGTASSACRCWPHKLKPIRGDHDPTGIALMAETIFGGKGVMFWIMQISTFAILILAANTAYADFPRLSSIIARDGFLPRQFANRGDRLVFSNGVILLAVVASLLIIVFDGDISKLIPLYAFGVFTGFTLSQAGMVRHHRRLKEPNWRVGMVINAIGCGGHRRSIATIVVVSKFTEGAWIPAALIPLDGARLLVDRQALPEGARRGAGADRLPGPAAHPLRRRARRQRQPGRPRGLAYARSLRPGADHRGLGRAGRRGAGPPPRAVGPTSTSPSSCTRSPRRTASCRPILDYIDELDSEQPDDIITVVIPEFVTNGVQPVAAQPDRAGAQGPAALPAAHGRRQRARSTSNA